MGSVPCARQHDALARIARGVGAGAAPVDVLAEVDLAGGVSTVAEGGGVLELAGKSVSVPRGLAPSLWIRRSWRRGVEGRRSVPWGGRTGE